MEAGGHRGGGSAHKKCCYPLQSGAADSWRSVALSDSTFFAPKKRILQIQVPTFASAEAVVNDADKDRPVGKDLRACVFNKDTNNLAIN